MRDNFHPNIQNALAEFLQNVPPERVAKTVRNLLLESLLFKQEITINENEHAYKDLAELFLFLDKLEYEWGIERPFEPDHK